MKKTNLKEKLQNWKLGNYFRELSIVTAGVFITLAGTDFINSASQEKGSVVILGGLPFATSPLCIHLC